MAFPIIVKMKGGTEIRIVKHPENDKEDIIFKNNNTNVRSLDEQIDLFSEIIINIYLENELKHEKRKHPNDP